MKRTGFIIYLIFGFCLMCPLEALTLITPRDQAVVDAPSVIILGESSSPLTLNGKSVKVYPNHSFVTTCPLQPGANTLHFVTKEASRNLIINRPFPRQTLPIIPLIISTKNLVPADNMALAAGDTVVISFQGSPGHHADAMIGNRTISLGETPQQPQLRKPTFSENQPAIEDCVAGVYSGSYRLQPEDRFADTPIFVKLSSGNETIQTRLPGRLSTFPQQPVIARTHSDNTIIRTSPGANRLTPLPAGVRLHLTGSIGNSYRFNLGPEQSGWVEAAAICLLPQGTPLPASNLFQILCEKQANALTLKLPLQERLPYTLCQKNETTLTLFLAGARLNIDFLRYPTGNPSIDLISAEQKSDTGSEITLRLRGSRLFGFQADYEKNTLVVSIKTPPTPTLHGKVITLDPGHGGLSEGAVGPTGIPEQVVNLAIANALKKELEGNGARVYLTRTTNGENPSFADRIKTATDSHSDLLISLHNNALPDGHDPLIEHGTSTYYYHEQALPLARSIQTALLKELGFADFGVFWGNLVMARPSWPVSVLVEVGFMIHPDEYARLITPDTQHRAAIAIRKGITNYYTSFK